MAANTAANVLVGATGNIYGAPTGTALPTTTGAALNAAFVNLGYVSDAGVVQSIGRDKTSIKAWGGDEVRVIRTSHELSYAFTMIETNPASLEAYYGEQTDVQTVVEISANAPQRQEWIIHVVDGVNIVRIVIPDGEIIETGDVTYSTEEAIGYPVTLSAYADTSGIKAYKYLLSPSVS